MGYLWHKLIGIMRKKKWQDYAKKYWVILKEAIDCFGTDRVPKLSGALAYNTIFSLAPMLMLIIIIGGSIYGDAAIQGKVFSDLKDLLGTDVANTIQEIILKIKFQQNNLLATIISSVVLLVAATGLFVEVQDSLNLIWGVRPKRKKGFIKFLLARVVSFVFILGFGLFFVLVLIISTLIITLSSQLLQYLPNLPFDILLWLNNVLLFFVITLFFALLYRMLPDVHVKWKDTWPGSFLTAALFLLAKYLISFYISGNRTVSLYGAAGSIIVFLIWIYLSAFVFYFGAEFTRAFAEYNGRHIEPNAYAEYSEKRLMEIIRKRLENGTLESLDDVEKFLNETIRTQIKDN